MATVKRSFSRHPVAATGQQENSIAISPLATTPVNPPEAVLVSESNVTEPVSESGFDPDDLWREEQVANLVEQQSQEFDYEEARLRQQVEAEMRLE